MRAQAANSIENDVFREALMPTFHATSSYRELAGLIGCSHEFVWMFVKGQRGLSLSSAVRMANALGLDLGEIQKECARRTMISAGRYRCTECKKELWEKGNVPLLAAQAQKHFCDVECETKWREYIFEPGSPYRMIADPSSPTSQREKN